MQEADIATATAAARTPTVATAAPATADPETSNSWGSARIHGPLRVAILGPGGVGGLLAATLVHSGHDVVCIAGDATAEALREQGIRVSSGRFGELAVAMRAETQLREPVDLCLIAVKHTALPEALDRLDAGALDNALIVPFLNGVEHPALLRARYGEGLVAPATIRVESTRLAPGVIEHSSPFADIDLASATAPSARLAAVLPVFAAAGFAVRVRDDETSMLWSKLSFIAPIALLTTRYGQTVGQIRAEHGDELYAAAEEVVAVGRASGAQVDLVDVVRLYRSLPDATKSSMQRDAEAGRAIELDAIGGAVLRAATLRDVPVPTLTGVIAHLAVRGENWS
ncbi:ketopantoate reductase family protein [Actinospica robiniae]|uniref:ketopantoate reductase family protein n=1 Tax=Actinospica robiniae TaxID=304901 RepID=UPI00041F97A3|nr:2-dehydropantoate 2-reductase [Actinospica robiniae]